MKKITSNPNKPVDKYIEQGEAILNADELAHKDNSPWALLDTIRGLLHIRLSTLRTKTRRLNEILADYKTAADAKNARMAEVKKHLKSLSIYVQNAWFFDASRLHEELGIAKPAPNDEEGLFTYLKTVCDALPAFSREKATDTRFILPEEYSQALHTNFIAFSDELYNLRDLREKRAKFTSERELALSEFREVLPPIRKWLQKNLPEGRKDARLSLYGFSE